MTFTVEHHVKSIRLTLEMMPKIGLSVPEELKDVHYPRLGTGHNAFNLHQELTFYQRLISLTDDPFLGLKLGTIYNLEAYGVFGYAILAVDSLAMALKVFNRFSLLTYTLHNISCDVQNGYGVVSMDMNKLKIADELKIFFADRDIAAVHVAFNHLLREKVTPECVWFTHDCQGQTDHYEAFFGCEVKTKMPTNRMIFSPALIQKPAPYRDQQAYELCVQLCHTQMQKMISRNDVLGEVKHLLRSRPFYLNSLEAVAKQLNMSGRTLRRRLENQHCSFKDIQQEIRQEMAEEYLSLSQLGISAIAELLGYSEAGNFTHAFKRWHNGVSPKQFRKSSMEKACAESAPE